MDEQDSFLRQVEGFLAPVERAVSIMRTLDHALAYDRSGESKGAAFGKYVDDLHDLIRNERLDDSKVMLATARVLDTRQPKSVTELRADFCHLGHMVLWSLLERSERSISKIRTAGELSRKQKILRKYLRTLVLALGNAGRKRSSLSLRELMNIDSALDETAEAFPQLAEYQAFDHLTWLGLGIFLDPRSSESRFVW